MTIRNHGEPIRTVTDGRDTIADIFEVEGGFEAILAEGRTLGVYETLKEAREAISKARRSQP